MIGKHYNREKYNCAHFVAEEFCLDISNLELFSRQFIKWMRLNFRQVNTPSDRCLVVMSNQDNSYHIGIYKNFMVHHNFESRRGAVCANTLMSIKCNYKKVRFYEWSK